MKKFARHKSLDELRAACADAGLVLDTSRYEEAASDHVVVRGKVHGKQIEVLFSTFNGRFFGKAGRDEFNSGQNLDGTPWFDALLDLFLVAKAAA